MNAVRMEEFHSTRYRQPGRSLAWDGLLAPLFEMPPDLRKIPWHFNAREMTNHIAWTACAGIVQRGAERLGLKAEGAR